jgi:hypothetical protein
MEHKYLGQNFLTPFKLLLDVFQLELVMSICQFKNNRTNRAYLYSQDCLALWILIIFYSKHLFQCLMLCHCVCYIQQITFKTQYWWRSQKYNFFSLFSFNVQQLFISRRKLKIAYPYLFVCLVTRPTFFSLSHTKVCEYKLCLCLCIV